MLNVAYGMSGVRKEALAADNKVGTVQKLRVEWEHGKGNPVRGGEGNKALQNG